MAAQPIYQFYAELNDYEPKIWRRFQVSNHITMARLGYILMTMFEMQASHLFDFSVPVYENFCLYTENPCAPEEVGEHWADDFPFFEGKKNWRFEFAHEDMMDLCPEDEELLNVEKEKVKSVVSHAREQMSFYYDYGDDWGITLTLEEIIRDKELPGKELPRVLAGAGYGIVENCGGVSGLEEIAKAFQRKKGKAYREFSEWLGREDLDMEKFDIEDINFRLKKIPRIYADIYEYGLEPTKRSLNLLERKYQEGKS